VAQASVVDIGKHHPLALKAAGVLTGDKAYDSRPLVTELWDAYRIKPVIDIRNLWKDGEISHVLPGYDHVPYDSKGVLWLTPFVYGLAKSVVIRSSLISSVPWWSGHSPNGIHSIR